MHLMLSTKFDRTYVMAILLAALFFLFVFNAFLATQLDNSSPHLISKDKVRKLYMSDFPSSLNFNSLPSDESGQYKIWKNVLSSEKRFFVPNRKDVSIATQCSVDNLYHIFDIYKQWYGRISVGVFVPGDDLMSGLKAISAIRLCSNGRMDHTTFHFVMPLASPPENGNLNIYIKRLEKIFHRWVCPVNLPAYLKGITRKKLNYEHEGLQYPVNLMRNLALECILSSHAVVIDIDMVPNSGLYQNLVQFLLMMDNIKKTVFVVPAFEVKDGCSLPSTKRSLLKSWQDGCVRPFYQEQCWKCQKYTLYDKWAGLPESSALISEYKASWHDPWEPFYVARTSEIHYDERFKQYGFNRISQICELHMGGFQFFVLNNAFLLHKGFKEKGSFHATKEEELDRNRQLYRQFKKEMIQKYPSAGVTC